MNIGATSFKKAVYEKLWISSQYTIFSDLLVGDLEGPELYSQTWSHMWVEFVGSVLCSHKFFNGYSGFPLYLLKNQPTI